MSTSIDGASAQMTAPALKRTRTIVSTRPLPKRSPSLPASGVQTEADEQEAGQHPGRGARGRVVLLGDVRDARGRPSSAAARRRARRAGARRGRGRRACRGRSFASQPSVARSGVSDSASAVRSWRVAEPTDPPPARRRRAQPPQAPRRRAHGLRRARARRGRRRRRPRGRRRRRHALPAVPDEGPAVEAIIEDRFERARRGVRRVAAADDDPWEAFAGTRGRARRGDRRATAASSRSSASRCSTRSSRAAQPRRRLLARIAPVLARAQEAGVVRADVARRRHPGPVRRRGAAAALAARGASPTSGGATSAVVLDGLRPEGATPLPGPDRPALAFRPSLVGVAQLVELLVVVQAVAGSSPVAHPSRRPRIRGAFVVLRRSRGNASGINGHQFGAGSARFRAPFRVRVGKMARVGRRSRAGGGSPGVRECGLKMRRLELAAGAPRRQGGATSGRPTRPCGQAERDLALQAQRAYERTVADWQANKVGAGATPGRASQRPSSGKAARQTSKPQRSAL